jgi:Phosphoribulokinase / Uridine kinase family
VNAIAGYTDLAREVLRRPAGLGRVRLVAVDGQSGAGKTVFGGRLATALREDGAHTEVVHTDDLLDGWADQFTFWPRLRDGVLEPLARGESGRYRRYDWVAGVFAEEHCVPVPDVLIIEGVSVARAEVRGRLTLAVFVTADPGLRLSRALARDGAAIEPELRRWMAAEDGHFARDATPERVDVLVDGGSRVEHDPDNGYVRLR